MEEKSVTERHEQALKFLTENYMYVIDKYKNEQYINNGKIEDIIWVCWWQGYDNAPEITKKCIESLRRHAGNRKVIIITEKNYKDYIDIPDYILKKVENGNMTITHLSDVIRIALLSKYGGVWSDATCYVSGSLEDYLNTDFFTVKLPYNEKETCISAGKWCIFFMATQKNNLLFNYALDFYYEYWKNENKVIDYYLTDYMFYLGYKEIPAIKELIDKVPENNENIHRLKEMLNFEYNANNEEYKKVLTTNKIHKLSYKLKYSDYTENDKPTIYNYIMNN